MAQTHRYSDTMDFYIQKDTYKNPMASMHFHSAFEIYYLISGEREYFIEDRFVKITDGDLLMVPPNTLHRTAGKGASRILLHFTEEFLLRYFSREMIDRILREKQIKILRAGRAEREKLEAILSSMLALYNDPDEANMDFPALAFHLSELLFCISSAKNNYVARSYSDQRISGIMQYINENYTKINSIEEIADHFFISKFYLCRLFVRDMGMPLITYLNMVKVRAACALIESEQLTLTEIALRCGFNSSSYFCKVFKAEMGLSPSAYRAQQKT